MPNRARWNEEQTTAGSPWPFGVQWVEADDAFNFSLYSRHATGVTLLCYTEEDPATTGLRISFPASGAQDGERLALPHPGARASRRHALRLSGRRAARTGARAALRSAEGPARSLRAVGVLPAGVQPRRVRPAPARPTDARRSAVCRASGPWPFRPRRAPRYTCQDAIVYELHVKGFTARANSGVTAGEARHVCRRDREDSLSQGPRRHGRRASPGPPVRSAGGQLLGLHDAALLLAASVVRARRGVRGIPDDGAGVPRGGHRGVARRRLQPHRRRRRRPGRPTAYRGIDNSSYYLLTPDRRHYINDTGCGNTVRTGHPGGARPGAREPPLLGAHDGRGWLSLRSRLDLFTRRRRHDERP